MDLGSTYLIWCGIDQLIIPLIELHQGGRALLDKRARVIMRKIDSTNIEKAENLIAKYGYRGKTLVGEPENPGTETFQQNGGFIWKLESSEEK